MSDFRARLKELNAELRALLQAEGNAHDSLKAELFENPRELLVAGGPHGLLYLASQCLDVAAKDCTGAHAHVDEWSGADEGSFPLTISLTLPASGA